MNLTQSGKLYLIPIPIAATTCSQVLPTYNTYIIHQIDYFIVENLRTARRFIATQNHPKPIEDIHFIELDKHASYHDIEVYMQPLHDGKDVGVLSEAGCPGIADPGAQLVSWGHKNNIAVVPLVGPCSLILALMASGLNGQHFIFHGYLPINKQDRKLAIQKMEMAAYQSGQTQIFIETPYRNEVMLTALLETCKPTTLLCIGKNITDAQGWVRTHPIHYWIKNRPTLHKEPTVFLLGGQ